MKRKLVSVLLALTLCGSLAVPAFAEPAEETHTPEEPTPLEVAAPEGDEVLTAEGAHEHEEAVAPEEAEAIIIIRKNDGHIHWVECDDVEPYTTENGDTVLGREYGYVCYDNSCQYAPPALTMSSDSIAAVTQSEAGFCLVCGEDDWGPPTDTRITLDPDAGGENEHGQCYYTVYVCRTCGYVNRIYKLAGLLPHSWSLSSYIEYKNITAATHTAIYNLTCVCTAKKYHSSETEPHSLQKGAFTGNHYHVEGSAKHMAEYRYTCSGCGYSTTKWEYYTCPGGSGGGCLYPTSLDEEELMEDVTGPEDAALPEDVVLPEDVTTPGDAMEPDETDAPGEIATPEETTGPEDQYE